MKGIYVLAMLAVVSLSLVPIVAEESDAYSEISYMQYGEIIATGSSENLNVPHIEAAEGYNAVWLYRGDVVDPYTFDYQDGVSYVFVYGVVPIDDPEPESDLNLDGIVLSVCVLAMILAIVALVVSRI